MFENIATLFEHPAFLYGLNLLNASAPSTQPKSFGGVLGEAGVNTIPMLQQAQTQRLLNQLRAYQVQQAQTQQEQAQRKRQFVEDLASNKWMRPAVPAQPTMLPDTQSVLGPHNSLEPPSIASHAGVLPAQPARLDQMGLLGAYLGAGHSPEGLDELMKYLGLGPKKISHVPPGSAIIDESGKVISTVPALQKEDAGSSRELADSLKAMGVTEGSPQWRNAFAQLAVKLRNFAPAVQVNMPSATTESYEMVNGEIHKFVVTIGKDGAVRKTDVGAVTAPPSKPAKKSAIEELLSSAPNRAPPLKIDPAIARKFLADPLMKDYSLGELEKGMGYKVIDANGTVIGHYN